MRRVRQRGELDAIAAAGSCRTISTTPDATDPDALRWRVSWSILFALIVVGVARRRSATSCWAIRTLDPRHARSARLADPMAPVDPNDSTKQVVTVPPGSTASDIGAELQQRGLVRSSLFFRLRRRPGRRRQQPGRGRLRAQPLDVDARDHPGAGQRRGQARADGDHSRGLAQRADRRPPARPPASPRATISSRPWPRRSPCRASTCCRSRRLPRLEGYLFPETYEVPQQVQRQPRRGADGAHVQPARGRRAAHAA